MSPQLVSVQLVADPSTVVVAPLARSSVANPLVLVVDLLVLDQITAQQAKGRTGAVVRVDLRAMEAGQLCSVVGP